ncbi:hypothetical protein YSA_07432 [Pseudomonas putida ND6]|uniref:Uncharacterized protein n=1 Tax=Pseudomonas putida ND6 TaxID=231023 RepID=I3UZ60_PSEPU|nr:hypothetical protein YSA_07432 [Pseudomonas putida ND6]
MILLETFGYSSSREVSRAVSNSGLLAIELSARMSLAFVGCRQSKA